jgi:sugar/nucleoside kinase (ribokinase family)
VCVGLATADLIVELPHWPEPDGRLVVEPMRDAEGGPAATAAVAAARLGASVSFVGAVGDDAAGERIRTSLADDGVDVAALEVLPGSSPRSVILVDTSTATRTILHAPGAQLEALSATARELLADAPWVHVDHAGWPLVADVPRSRLSVDAGNPIPGLELSDLGMYAPTASAIRARYPGAALGPAVHAALDEGALRVAVTLGREGAVAAEATGAWRAPPPTVEIRSTLGAGDVFHGALVAELAAGRPLPEALATATIAATLSCRAIDGRSAIPSRDELETVRRTTPPVEPILLDDLA